MPPLWHEKTSNSGLGLISFKISRFHFRFIVRSIASGRSVGITRISRVVLSSMKRKGGVIHDIQLGWGARARYPWFHAAIS